MEINEEYIIGLKNGSNSHWDDAGRIIRNIMWKYVQVEDDAKDLAQEVVIKKWKAIDRFVPSKGKGKGVKPNFLAWLKTNVCNEWINWKNWITVKKKKEEEGDEEGKKSRREIPISSLVEEGSQEEMLESLASKFSQAGISPQEDIVYKKEFFTALHECIDKSPSLDDLDRLIAKYRFVCFEKIKDIALILGRDEDMVNTRLNRLKPKLKDCLEKKEIDTSFL